jgi:hypothetical protein
MHRGTALRRTKSEIDPMDECRNNDCPDGANQPQATARSPLYLVKLQDSDEQRNGTEEWEAHFNC